MSHETRKLTVKRYGVEQINALYLSATRLMMEVVGTNMPSEVFIHRRSAINPRTGQFLDEFMGVAGAVDMEVYPAVEPEADTEFHFFRKSEFDILLRTPALAAEARRVALEEMEVLVHALNRLENLKLLETITIGPYPDDPDHTSESEAL